MGENTLASYNAELLRAATRKPRNVASPFLSFAKGYHHRHSYFLRGSNLGCVYSSFRKGSPPLGMSWLARPFSSSASNSRPRVIFPIGVRATPRKEFGRSFALRGGTV